MAGALSSSPPAQASSSIYINVLPKYYQILCRPWCERDENHTFTWVPVQLVTPNRASVNGGSYISSYRLGPPWGTVTSSALAALKALVVSKENPARGKREPRGAHDLSYSTNLGQFKGYVYYHVVATHDCGYLPLGLWILGEQEFPKWTGLFLLCSAQCVSGPTQVFLEWLANAQPLMV